MLPYALPTLISVSLCATRCVQQSSNPPCDFSRDFLECEPAVSMTSCFQIASPRFRWFHHSQRRIDGSPVGMTSLGTSSGLQHECAGRPPRYGRDLLDSASSEH